MMNEICPACSTAAKVRDNKILVWITCEKCGEWLCASGLPAKIAGPTGQLARAAKRGLEGALRRDGYGVGKHCLRVLLYDADLPSIAPLVNVVPIQLGELADPALLSDGRLTTRENAFRGEYNRADMLLNPGAFVNNRYVLP